MAAATQTTMSNVLIPFFLDECIRDLPTDVPFLDYFTQDKEAFGGSQMQFRVQVKGNPSGGFRPGTRIARPGIVEFQWATVTMKRAYFSTSIDLVFDRLTKQTRPQPVLQALKENVDSLRDNGKKKIELAFLGAGDGAIAQVDGAHAIGDTTIQLKDPEGRSFGGARHVEQGAFIVIWPEGVPVACIVSTVDWDTETVTITYPAGGLPVAVPDGAAVVFGDPDGNSYNNEPDGGLKALFADPSVTPNYLGLSRNDYYIWATNSFGAVTDDLPWNTARLLRGMAVPKQVSKIKNGQRVMFTHDWTIFEYLEQEAFPKEHYVNVNGVYSTGAVRVAFRDGTDTIPIETVPVCPYGDIYVLRAGDWHVPMLGSDILEIVKPVSGNGIMHEVPGYHEGFVYGAFFGNVYCRRPKGQVRFRGLRINQSDLPR